MNRNHWTVEQFDNEKLARFNQGKILTLEELADRHANVLISHTEVLIHGEQREQIAFYSTNHCWGPQELPDAFVPTSSYLPHKVAPRPGFETGVILTPFQMYQFDKQCAKEAEEYGRRTKFIFSIEELVEHLNKYY